MALRSLIFLGLIDTHFYAVRILWLGCMWTKRTKLHHSLLCVAKILPHHAPTFQSYSVWLILIIEDYIRQKKERNFFQLFYVQKKIIKWYLPFIKWCFVPQRRLCFFLFFFLFFLSASRVCCCLRKKVQVTAINWMFLPSRLNFHSKYQHFHRMSFKLPIVSPPWFLRMLQVSRLAYTSC